MTASGSSRGRSQNCLAWAWLLRPHLVKSKGEIKAKITSFKCLKKSRSPAWNNSADQVFAKFPQLRKSSLENLQNITVRRLLFIPCPCPQALGAEGPGTRWHQTNDQFGPCSLTPVFDLNSYRGRGKWSHIHTPPSAHLHLWKLPSCTFTRRSHLSSTPSILQTVFPTKI